MTAVAVECRPAMGSCMVGIRLCTSCALTALRVPVIRESIRKCMDGWRRDILTVKRGPKVSQVRM